MRPFSCGGFWRNMEKSTHNEWIGTVVANELELGKEIFNSGNNGIAPHKVWRAHLCFSPSPPL